MHRAGAAQALKLAGSARGLPEAVCQKARLAVRTRYRNAAELVLKVSDVAIGRGEDQIAVCVCPGSRVDIMYPPLQHCRTGEWPVPGSLAFPLCCKEVPLAAISELQFGLCLRNNDCLDLHGCRERRSARE